MRSIRPRICGCARAAPDPLRRGDHHDGLRGPAHGRRGLAGAPGAYGSHGRAGRRQRIPRAGWRIIATNYRGGVDEAGILVGRTAMLVLGHPEPNAI